MTENPDIIAICEAKPKNGALRGNVECKITGFNTMHVNMNQEQNRGIIIYIKESMAHATVQLNLEMFQKACIIKIMLKDNNILLFCCIYRSPMETANSSENNEKLNLLWNLYSTTKSTRTNVLLEILISNWSIVSTGPHL